MSLKRQCGITEREAREVSMSIYKRARKTQWSCLLGGRNIIWRFFLKRGQRPHDWMRTNLWRKDLASQNTTKSIKRRDSSVQYSILHSIIAHPVQKAFNTSKVLSLLFSVVAPEEEAVRNRSTCRMMILSKTWLCEVMRPVMGLVKNQNYYRGVLTQYTCVLASTLTLGAIKSTLTLMLTQNLCLMRWWILL